MISEKFSHLDQKAGAVNPGLFAAIKEFANKFTKDMSIAQQKFCPSSTTLYKSEIYWRQTMFNVARYLAIIAIGGFALSTEAGSPVATGLMQKEILAAALIALLSLPTILRWSR